MLWPQQPYSQSVTMDWQLLQIMVECSKVGSIAAGEVTTMDTIDGETRGGSMVRLVLDS